MRFLFFLSLISNFYFSNLLAANCVDALGELNSIQMQGRDRAQAYLIHLIEKDILSIETVKNLLKPTPLKIEDIRFHERVTESEKVSYLKGLRIILEENSSQEKWDLMREALLKYMKEKEGVQAQVANVKEATREKLTPSEEAFRRTGRGLDQDAQFTGEEVRLRGVKHYVVRSNGYVFLVNSKTFAIKLSEKHRMPITFELIEIKGKKYFLQIINNKIKFIDPNTFKTIKSFYSKKNVGSLFNPESFVLVKSAGQYKLFYYTFRNNITPYLEVVMINSSAKKTVSETEIEFQGKLIGPPALGKLEGKEVIFQITETGLAVIDPETLKNKMKKIKIHRNDDLDIKQVKYINLNGEDIFYYGGDSKSFFYNLNTGESKMRVGAGKIVETQKGLLFVSTLHSKKEGLRLTGEILSSFKEIDAKKGSFETPYNEEQIYNIGADVDKRGTISLMTSQSEITFIDPHSGQELYKLPVNLNLDRGILNDGILDVKIVKNEKGEEILLVLTVQGIRPVVLYH